MDSIGVEGRILRGMQRAVRASLARLVSLKFSSTYPDKRGQVKQC
jgi:hypothetical protein